MFFIIFSYNQFDISRSGEIGIHARLKIVFPLSGVWVQAPPSVFFLFISLIKMSSTILDLVKLNEKIDYSFVIPLALLYVVGFWVLVSVWVYIDSRKRIVKKRNRILILIANLIFGIPFFLLYLLARPYDREEEEDINEAINLPLANFTGKDGILMSLELKISPSLISGNVANNYDAKMKIGVELETSDSIKIEENLAEKVEPVVIPVTTSSKNNVIDLFKGLLKSKENKIDQDKIEDKVMSEISTDNSNDKPFQKGNKKKNKKRKH